MGTSIHPPPSVAGATGATGSTGATGAAGSTAKRVASNVALAASTTVSLSDLDISTAANDTWILDYAVSATVSAGVAGLAPVMSLPSGATGTMIAYGPQGVLGTLVLGALSTSLTTTFGTAFATAALTGATIMVRVTVTTPNAGTVRLGFVTGALAAGNILAGSSLLAAKV